MTDFAIGSLVHARGREWVVLPESEDELLVLRPLGGTDDEITGLDTLLEDARSATFALPDPTQAGDFRSARMLYDAVRLGFRASAGPFRSFASLGVEPRPYQLVPLLMALKMDPVRLLIADDVGIGKTVEAGLIAKELLARGDAHGLTVLCPPQLAEQWQRELAEKFHIEAELVLPSTARRLEKRVGFGQSIFDVYPYTVVSLDYVKSDRRRDLFVQSCPDLVIVDEAHTCAEASGRGAQHQRHELVKRLSERPDRHLVLVTATPHSGKEEAFRSLLTLLDEQYANLPDDLSGPAQEPVRRRLAEQFVQRRRADVRHFAKEDTPFPDRLESEASYDLTPAYATLFNDVLDYTRESVGSAESGSREQRVRWWSALSLLRALASSPAAAAATLRNRAASAEAKTAAEADEIGRHRVLDLVADDDAEGADLVHGARLEDDEGDPKDRSRLRVFARSAEALEGSEDAKLATAIALVKRLLKEGHHPILFCRFIPTAEYVADALRSKLRGVEVSAVTGRLAPAEREARVGDLAQADQRVLVATDCLSEGINLQEAFDAVVHYDLAWNPTRHEQREGRVDRYGQPREEVRVVTLFGKDNQIDGLVLDVLLRKHKTIRTQLGISVPVPSGSDALVEAVFEGLVLRGARVSSQQMGLFDEIADASARSQRDEVHDDWDESARQEKRSRTMFAQRSIKTDDVVRELEAVRSAIGGALDVRRFVTDAVQTYGGVVAPENDGTLRLDLEETPRGLRDAVGGLDALRARFEGPVESDEVRLVRTHPVVEGLASWVLDAALDGEGRARRSGVIRTRAVSTRTTVLLVRFRFHLVVGSGANERQLLAEDVGALGFQGSPEAPEWLPEDLAAATLRAEPDANVGLDQARHFLQRVVDGFDALAPMLDEEAMRRADALLDAHRRVRDASKGSGRYRVEPQLPPDVLGLYILLPTPN